MKLGITSNGVGMKEVGISVKPDDFVFVATNLQPWEVSEREFTNIVAMLADGSLDCHERENVLAFFALACDMAAQHDPTIADVSGIYRAARAQAQALGEMVFEG
jgi:hypothetical protein